MKYRRKVRKGAVFATLATSAGYQYPAASIPVATCLDDLSPVMGVRTNDARIVMNTTVDH